VITHQIKLTKKPEVITLCKPRLRAGSEAHKISIVKGTIKYNSHNYGDSVVTATGHRGQVVDILGTRDLERIEWEGLKPHIIEVYFHDGLYTELFHPADLKGIA
jgi:hypothetical protein